MRPGQAHAGNTGEGSEVSEMRAKGENIDK